MGSLGSRAKRSDAAPQQGGKYEAAQFTGRQNLVYKHAISTISPSKVISILETAEDDQDEE